MCVLCNPCVCLCAIRVCVCGRFFIVNYVVFWACLKDCKGGHFIRVFTFKMTCSIRVCVFGVRLSPYLRGETQIGRSGGRRKLRFWDTPQLSHTKGCITICARTRTCRLVGGTPRQPKSEHFHTKGLSAICHFLAPWKSPFLCVKCSGGRSRVFTREKARESSEPLFKG